MSMRFTSLACRELRRAVLPEGLAFVHTTSIPNTLRDKSDHLTYYGVGRYAAVAAETEPRGAR